MGEKESISYMLPGVGYLPTTTQVKWNSLFVKVLSKGLLWLDAQKHCTGFWTNNKSLYTSVVFY